MPPNKNFQLVWNWQGPERIRTFLCLVTHNIILTNSEKRRRHLTNDDACPRCRCHEESTIHVLRDCPMLKASGKALSPLTEGAPFLEPSSMIGCIKTCRIRKTGIAYLVLRCRLFGTFGISLSSMENQFM
ncbi:hypothetical protein AHAS_Ahas01G0272600 [Arachis hypogaea]